MSTEQLSMFDGDQRREEPAVNRAAFDSATHHQLDDFSSITQVHGLVVSDVEMMGQIGDAPGWEQRSRWMYDRRVAEPRLTNEFRDLSLAPAMLVELAAALSDYCEVPYDGVWMNWYRDQRDSTSWHADRPANQPSTAVVPVVSLGATRRFLIRPTGGGQSIAFTPRGGDVLIMRGRCQRDWQHCVPKQQTPAAARMSLNYTSSTQVRAA